MKQYALISIFTTEGDARKYRRILRRLGYEFAIVIINDSKEGAV